MLHNRWMILGILAFALSQGCADFWHGRVDLRCDQIIENTTAQFSGVGTCIDVGVQVTVEVEDEDSDIFATAIEFEANSLPSHLEHGVVQIFKFVDFSLTSTEVTGVGTATKILVNNIFGQQIELDNPARVYLPYDVSAVDTEELDILYAARRTESGSWVYLDDIEIDTEAGLVSGTTTEFNNQAVDINTVFMPVLDAPLLDGIIDGVTDGVSF